jgi:hypothetical protein
MSNNLLAVVACIYIYVAFTMFAKRDYGSAMAWFFYAMANIGFILQYILDASRRAP